MCFKKGITFVFSTEQTSNHAFGTVYAPSKAVKTPLTMSHVLWVLHTFYLSKLLVDKYFN